MITSVAIVTGASKGLGLESARKLAAKGYEVVVTARSAADAEGAAQSIRLGQPAAKVHALTLDLTRPESVDAFVAAFAALDLPLHLLVNNAGLMSLNPKPSFTAEGFETTLATNHIGHVRLTSALWAHLVRSAPSRVVVVSSGMHRKGEGPGPGPDFDYANLKAEKDFHPTTAYRNSKLANLWFAAELARRGTEVGVTVVSVSPGWVPESQADYQASAFARFLFKRVLPHLPFCRTVDQGSANTVFAATDPGVVAGTYYEDQKPGKLSEDAQNAELAKRAWGASLEWAGVKAW